MILSILGLSIIVKNKREWFFFEQIQVWLKDFKDPQLDERMNYTSIFKKQYKQRKYI